MHKNELPFVQGKWGMEVSEELIILSPKSPDCEENLTAVCAMLIFISTSVFSMLNIVQKQQTGRSLSETGMMQMWQLMFNNELVLNIMCEIIHVQCDLNTTKHPD